MRAKKKSAREMKLAMKNAVNRDLAAQQDKVNAWRRVAQFRSALEQARGALLAQVATIDAVLAVPIEMQKAAKAARR